MVQVTGSTTVRTEINLRPAAPSGAIDLITDIGTSDLTGFLGDLGQTLAAIRDKGLDIAATGTRQSYVDSIQKGQMT